MQVSRSLLTPWSSSTQVCAKAPPSPARPPVMGIFGPSTSVMPDNTALPLIFTPWPNISTARKSVMARPEASRFPAANESSMDANVVLICARVACSKRTAVTTSVPSSTPLPEISPAVEQPARCAAGNTSAKVAAAPRRASTEPNARIRLGWMAARAASSSARAGN